MKLKISEIVEKQRGKKKSGTSEMLGYICTQNTNPLFSSLLGLGIGEIFNIKYI